MKDTPKCFTMLKKEVSANKNKQQKIVLSSLMLLKLIREKPIWTPATTPADPQRLIYSLGSPNFSSPVIAVREFVCHPMSGDNAHFFRSTRLCGLMMKKFWRPDCEGLWEQIKGKYSIAWAPWWYVGTRLIARKLSENRLNLEMISTQPSISPTISSTKHTPTKHTLNLYFDCFAKKNWRR